MLYTYYIPLSTHFYFYLSKAKNTKCFINKAVFTAPTGAQVILMSEPKILCKKITLKFLSVGEMRGEAAPYSLVPSEESSLLHEREGEGAGELAIKTGPATEKKRRYVLWTFRG